MKKNLQLDGIRGLAILLVLCVHTPILLRPLGLDGAAQQGWFGVDLFFVLSGFLITSILFNTVGEPGWRTSFYWRRALRILPVYLLVMTYAFLILPRMSPAASGWHRSAFWWGWYAVFLQNWAFPGYGYTPLFVTWSLAVEEQFYVVWSTIVGAAGRKLVGILATATVIVSPLIRWWGIHHGIDWNTIYTRTVFHLDGLAIGALLALWYVSAQERERWSKWFWSAAIGGAVLSFASLLSRNVHEGQHSILIYSTLALCFGGIVGLAALEELPLFRWRPLRFLGTISYGLYLYHPLTFMTYEISPLRTKLAPHPWIEGLVRNGLAISVASLSYFQLECRVLSYKDALPARSKFEPMKAVLHAGN